MRILRFRAWDKGLKQMFYDKDCFFTFQDGILIERDGEKSESGDDVMMWTGLTDQHGKEIWEGDIVRLSDSTYEVRLGNGRWEIYAEDERGDFNTSELFGWDRYLKVIGNSYENPELLK